MEKNIVLYFKSGSSNKEYHASIEPSGTGYLVNFAYGRRGTALHTGTKTQSPVTLEKAEKIFDKLVKSKAAKGYTPSKDGRMFAMSDTQTSLFLTRSLNNLKRIGSPSAPNSADSLASVPLRSRCNFVTCGFVNIRLNI